MKNKICEVENDNFILKYIKNDEKDSKEKFGYCYFKKEKKISFKFDYNFYKFKFGKCECEFNIYDGFIQCYSLSKDKNKLYIKEKLNKEKGKNFNFDLFISNIGNKNHSFILLHYNIINNLNFAIDNKIIYSKKINEFLKIFTNKIPDFKKKLYDYKKLLEENKEKEIKEYKEISNGIELFFDSEKRILSEIQLALMNNKPQENFELETHEYKYLFKSQTYFFYSNNKEKILLEINYHPLYIHYFSDKGDEIFIDYKNKDNCIFQISDKILFLFKIDFNYSGLLNEKFGIEKGKKYTYIGNYFNDLYNGQGLLISQSYIYKGNFLKGNKTDKNCLILIDNIIYKGGIENNELKGKGEYNNKGNKKIEADFEKGDISGKCKFTYKNGDTFEGNMKNGIKKGEWIYIPKDKKMNMKAIYNEQNQFDIQYNY